MNTKTIVTIEGDPNGIDGYTELLGKISEFETWLMEMGLRVHVKMSETEYEYIPADESEDDIE